MTPYLNWICNSEQWNECWKDVFGEIGVGSFLGNEHHVGEDKRDHVVVGALLAEARKHSLHVHSLQQRTSLSGYRFLFRHSLFRQFLFRQFIFGRKSIHASDVRNCHCTFGVTLYAHASGPHILAKCAYRILFPDIPTMFTYFPHIPAYFHSLLVHIWAYSEYVSHIFPACTQRIFGK